jgi:dihydroneopterin aldolase
MPSIGKLTIGPFKTEVILGVLPHERETPQTIEVLIEVEVDFEPSAPATGDTPRDTSTTIDWSQVHGRACELLNRRKFRLAETACMELCRTILNEPKALSVKSRVTKLELGGGLESVSAEVFLRK